MRGITSALIGLTWRHLVAAVVVYIASLVFYRLYLGPLAHFPGPKLAAVTRYVEAYHDIIRNGQYTFEIAKMHKIYGPIVRISPYELHINDPAFVEKLYRNDRHYDKYAWSIDAFGAQTATITTVDHEAHRHRRAAMSPSFSKARVTGSQELLQRFTTKLCYRIGEFDAAKTTSIDLGSAISAFTRDVAMEFLLAKNYNNLDKPNFNAGMTDVFQKSGSVWRITKHIHWYGPLMKALPMKFVEKTAGEGVKSFFVFLKDMTQFTKDTVDAWSAGELDSNDESTMLHTILRSNFPPAEKTVERTWSEVATATGAAFETTASALRLILAHVYSDPGVLEKLRAELASSTQTDTAHMNITALEKLPYLTAVLMEGLRLSPGIASRASRVAPDEEIVYRGWRIPAGTAVGMTTLLMHMDESLYPEPEKFLPQRWINTEVRKNSDRFFAPFSRGARVCLGLHLAWAELYMVLAAVVQRFDFTLDGVRPQDFRPISDQFIIGTKNESNFKVFVTRYEG